MVAVEEVERRETERGRTEIEVVPTPKQVVANLGQLTADVEAEEAVEVEAPADNVILYVNLSLLICQTEYSLLH